MTSSDDLMKELAEALRKIANTAHPSREAVTFKSKTLTVYFAESDLKHFKTLLRRYDARPERKSEAST